jgi:signal peptidase I
MEPTLHAGQYLIVNKLLYRLHPPERGDIIVFEYPKAPDRDFIKRVIGLPGEEIEIRNGKVYVNGIPLEEDYISREPAYTYAKHTVGPDEVFVLGDNRNSSSDSHTWGMLPVKNIIGKAWVSYWPPKEWGLIPNHSFASSND